jgi:hypothetical protein
MSGASVITAASPAIGNEPYLDPRLVFLARASARYSLVELGAMDIDDAITGLAGAVEDLYGLHCFCATEVIDRWDRDYPPARRRGRRSSWR